MFDHLWMTRDQFEAWVDSYLNIPNKSEPMSLDEINDYLTEVSHKRQVMIYWAWIDTPIAWEGAGWYRQEVGMYIRVKDLEKVPAGTEVLYIAKGYRDRNDKIKIY